MDDGEAEDLREEKDKALLLLGELVDFLERSNALTKATMLLLAVL